MESSTSNEGQASRSAYEVAIWCLVNGKDEEEVKEIVYKYCQQLKEFFAQKLVVTAVEVGLNSIQP